MNKAVMMHQYVRYVFFSGRLADSMQFFSHKGFRVWKSVLPNHDLIVLKSKSNED